MVSEIHGSRKLCSRFLPVPDFSKLSVPGFRGNVPGKVCGFIVPVSVYFWWLDRVGGTDFAIDNHFNDIDSNKQNGFEAKLLVTKLPT